MNKTLTEYERNDLLEQAMIHAENAQVARRNVISAKSQSKKDLFKSIAKKEGEIVESLMKEAGI
jgi:hypothetical protein